MLIGKIEKQTLCWLLAFLVSLGIWGLNNKGVSFFAGGVSWLLPTSIAAFLGVYKEHKPKQVVVRFYFSHLIKHLLFALICICLFCFSNISVLGYLLGVVLAPLIFVTSNYLRLSLCS